MATDALFASWFDLADVDRDGALSGQEAVQFLLRSGLPQQTLKRVRERAHSHMLNAWYRCDAAAAARCAAPHSAAASRSCNAPSFTPTDLGAQRLWPDRAA